MFLRSNLHIWSANVQISNKQNVGEEIGEESLGQGYR